MTRNHAVYLLAGITLLPAVALANWTGKGELGAAQATANTGATSTTLTAKFDLATEVDRWKHAFGGSTVYNTAKAEATATDQNPQDKTSAKRWELHEQTNYNFSSRAFWFGAVRHEHDSVGSFKYQSTLGAGIGYKFIENDDTTLIGQAGAGYKRFKRRQSDPNVVEKTENSAIVTAGLELKQKLSDNTLLLDKLAIEAGSDNKLVTNDLALQVKMTDVLALSLGYQIRYNTKPGKRAFPVNSGDYAHSDRLLTANLVYEFK